MKVTNLEWIAACLALFFATATIFPMLILIADHVGRSNMDTGFTDFDESILQKLLDLASTY